MPWCCQIIVTDLCHWHKSSTQHLSCFSTAAVEPFDSFKYLFEYHFRLFQAAIGTRRLRVTGWNVGVAGYSFAGVKARISQDYIVMRFVRNALWCPFTPKLVKKRVWQSQGNMSMELRLAVWPFCCRVWSHAVGWSDCCARTECMGGLDAAAETVFQLSCDMVSNSYVTWFQTLCFNLWQQHMWEETAETPMCHDLKKAWQLEN